MVVAPGTTDRQAQHRGRDDPDRIGDDLVAGDGRNGTPGSRSVGSHSQESRRRQVLDLARVEDFSGYGNQLVSCDLHHQELVEGPVVVETANDEVPVAKCRGPDPVVGGVAFRIGVTGGIQPVSAPAFSVMRRGQQAGDQPLPGLRLSIVDEGRHLGGRRRQAQQVKGHTTNHRPTIGGT